MAADENGLIHGGFTFSAADYSAMVAVNEPNVVLGKAEVKFLAPVKSGDKVVFEANVVNIDGKKSSIEVVGAIGNLVVFKGTFGAYTPQNHILS